MNRVQDRQYTNFTALCKNNLVRFQSFIDGATQEQAISIRKALKRRDARTKIVLALIRDRLWKIREGRRLQRRAKRIGWNLELKFIPNADFKTGNTCRNVLYDPEGTRVERGSSLTYIGEILTMAEEHLKGGE